MRPRRIAAAAAAGLPAAVAAAYLISAAQIHFANREHTLHYGDTRFDITGHTSTQPRTYVDDCRFCDQDRLAAAHWTRTSTSWFPDQGQPGHLAPADGCIHCQEGISPQPRTAAEIARDLEEGEEAWRRTLEARRGRLAARLTDLLVDTVDAILTVTVDPLCDRLERRLWRSFPPQPAAGGGRA